MGETIFFGVALFGFFRDGGAAWVGETEDFGDFVERFADGVVGRCADDFEVVMAGHFYYLGVAAGDD